MEHILSSCPSLACMRLCCSWRYTSSTTEASENTLCPQQQLRVVCGGQPPGPLVTLCRFVCQRCWNEPRSAAPHKRWAALLQKEKFPKWLISAFLALCFEHIDVRENTWQQIERQRGAEQKKQQSSEKSLAANRETGALLGQGQRVRWQNSPYILLAFGPDFTWTQQVWEMFLHTTQSLIRFTLYDENGKSSA